MGHVLVGKGELAVLQCQDLALLDLVSLVVAVAGRKGDKAGGDRSAACIMAMALSSPESDSSKLSMAVMPWGMVRVGSTMICRSASRPPARRP